MNATTIGLDIAKTILIRNKRQPDLSVEPFGL